MAAWGREQRKPELHMPCITCSCYVSKTGFWYLFCIRNLEIKLESIYSGLGWGRGERRLPPGWFWLALAHFLCCLDLHKAVFDLRGSVSIQTAFWGHCCHEVTGPQRSSFAFKGTHSLHWSYRTCWPGCIACSQDAWVPIAAPWPHPSPSPCPPSPPHPSLWRAGLRSAYLRGSTKPWVHLPRAKAPKCIHIWDWLLVSPLQHPVPRGLTEMWPGTVCICEDSGKRKVQNAVPFQHHLPALLAVSKVK